jgi:hypothetical protein
MLVSTLAHVTPCFVGYWFCRSCLDVCWSALVLQVWLLWHVWHATLVDGEEIYQ